MAKAIVHHSCGHTSTLMGHNRKNADYRAGKAAAHPCWECERAASSAAAARAAQDSGLPALTGSEKQIAWAETLRIAEIKAFDRAGAELVATEASQLTAQAIAEISDGIALLRVEMTARTAARDWIDARDKRHDSAAIWDKLRKRELVPTAIAELRAACGAG